MKRKYNFTPNTGYKPCLEGVVTIVDCSPTTLIAGCGVAPKDQKHLDKSRGYESHDSIIPPRNLEEYNALNRGLGGMISRVRAAIRNTSSVPAESTASLDPVEN